MNLFLLVMFLLIIFLIDCKKKLFVGRMIFCLCYVTFLHLWTEFYDSFIVVKGVPLSWSRFTTEIYYLKSKRSKWTKFEVIKKNVCNPCHALYWGIPSSTASVKFLISFTANEWRHMVWFQLLNSTVKWYN